MEEQASLEFDLTFGDVLLHELVLGSHAEKKLVFVHFYNIRKNINKRTQKTCAYLRNIFSEIAMISFQKRGKYIVVTHICTLHSLCSY